MGLNVYLKEIQPVVVFEKHITHNLAQMADQIGVYKHLWRPDEIGIEKAGQLIQPLRDAIQIVRSDVEGRLRKFEPENKWGTRDYLLEFMNTLLDHCEEYPDAAYSVSR